MEEVLLIFVLYEGGEFYDGLEGSSCGIICGCEGKLLSGVSFSDDCGGEVDG